MAYEYLIILGQIFVKFTKKSKRKKKSAFGDIRKAKEM